MVEKVLVEYSYDIDEEIIKEDCGFVHKIMSNNDEIVKKVEKASKSLEKDLAKADKLGIEEADEKLKPLLKVFAESRDKIVYSFDVFDNGVIRIFESEDEGVAEKLKAASDSLRTTDDERSKAEASAENRLDEESAQIEEWDPEKERAEEEAELAEMEKKNQEAVDEESQEDDKDND